MKRRKFLTIAATGAAALPWAARAAIAGESEALTVLATPRLLDILRDGGAVAAIGERYRQSVTAEGNVDALFQAVLGDLNVNQPITSPALLRDLIEAQVRRDFYVGRTVTLNGWVLSRTEARQCALYALQAA